MKHACVLGAALLLGGCTTAAGREADRLVGWYSSDLDQEQAVFLHLDADGSCGWATLLMSGANAVMTPPGEWSLQEPASGPRTVTVVPDKRQPEAVQFEVVEAEGGIELVCASKGLRLTRWPDGSQ